MRVPVNHRHVSVTGVLLISRAPGFKCVFRGKNKKPSLGISSVSYSYLILQPNQGGWQESS